jgi:DNA-repair protein XRCC3
MSSSFVSALQLVQRQIDARAIVSFCAELDSLLGGGVRPGQTVELCGEPGTGTTTLSLQLAVDAAIPPLFNGLGGGALIVDTEFAVSALRLAQLSAALALHLRTLFDAQFAATDAAQRPPVPPPTRDEILAGIHIVRPRSHVELAALCHALPHLVRTLGVRIVVIDSVAALVRGEPLLDDKNGALRTRLLTALAQRLCETAHSCNVAVVVTNHLTIAPRAADAGATMMQMPALGDRWRHWCETRILLEFDGVNRTARLLKGCAPDTITVPFRICADGVRD